MSHPDFNLLITLDALLSEGSVAKAAKHLNLSPSAMSRALARLRETTGDPLLVRAGRGLVPTPRALEMREQVARLVQMTDAVLSPQTALDLQTLSRTFTIRNREGFVENFGPALLTRIAQDAPHVRLHFVSKPDKDSTGLRDGRIDLETGVVSGTIGPEIRAQALFYDHFIGAVRRDHTFAHGDITPARFADSHHIQITRRGSSGGPIDTALQSLNLTRNIVTVVDNFSEALTLARASDLIAIVPARYTENLRADMFCFALPVPVPEITVSLLWHPRMDADLAHRWLRQCVRDVCAD